MERVTLSTGPLDRSYLLARPAATARTRPPVVVFLHGTGGTAEWADEETGWPAFAERHGFVLAVPEGWPPFPDQPPKFLTNPQRWNDGSTRPGHPLHSDADDVGFLEAVIADTVERCDADPMRVFLTGFSNGAGMTFRFAAERAALLAGVAPVAGHCWVDHPKPSKPLPTLYLIGDADPLIPVRGGSVRSPWGGRLSKRPPLVQTLEKWASAIGCETISRLDRERDGVREEVFPGPVEYRCVTVEGLGHHWPGGAGKLNPRLAGPPSDRVNASEVIWEFFRTIG